MVIMLSLGTLPRDPVQRPHHDYPELAPVCIVQGTLQCHAPDRQNSSIDTAARYFRAGSAENAAVIERIFGS
jgi:hypothetical protein